jgi:hypothetical protein
LEILLYFLFPDQYNSRELYRRTLNVGKTHMI